MKTKEVLGAERKALMINLDDSIYGAFAEIGAGQEVARHFFKVGRASHTIAKTMSAYDMTVSDSIYGKTGRYVCEERLVKMLDHEFELVQSRLGPTRGNNTKFFAFADTVATSSHHEAPRCHGWIGIRYQSKVNGPQNQIVMHVSMLDQMRLDQQKALGILGVNLIYAAFKDIKDPSEFVSSLSEELGPQRIEIDLLVFNGPDLDSFDHRELALELVNQGLTKAVLFGQNGKTLQAGDTLFKKPLMVQRGTFRPFTKVNAELIDKGLEQLHRLGDLNNQKPYPLLEITLKSLEQSDSIDRTDILQRLDTIRELKYPVLISRYTMFYELKNYLRSCTNNVIGFVIGAPHLEKILDSQYYNDLNGGLLEAMGKLFDSNSGFLIYPFKTDQICVTAGSFHPNPRDFHLFAYLSDLGKFVDMMDCEHIDTSLQSSDVRTMLKNNDNKWETLVPKPIVKLIKERKLFL